jgi:hypothetical protein
MKQTTFFLLTFIILFNSSNILYGTDLRFLFPFEIKVYASSEYSHGYPARNTVNGKGMAGDFHDNLKQRSWRSTANHKQHTGTASGEAWIKYEFDTVKTIREILIWNEQEQPDMGLKDIIIESSIDGEKWKLVREVVLPKEEGKIMNKVSSVLELNNEKAKFIIITALSRQTSGKIFKLAEVKFKVETDGKPIVSPVKNLPGKTTLSFYPKRAIAIARAYPDTPPEKLPFTPADIKRIKEMGFDAVKTVNNPYAHKNGAELKNTEFLKGCINTITKQKLPAIVCIHPPGTFKQDHFQDKDKFQELLDWYKNLGSFLVKHWNEKEIFLQVMTEPAHASTDPDAWNYFSTLQQRIWKVLRTVMPPEYCLILSGDESGNLEALYFITPVNDPNVMYSFTHHRPHIFAFQGSSLRSHWETLKGIEYPVTTKLTDARLNKITINVPSSHQYNVKREISGYYAERWNYERQYEMMKTLKDWNTYWGGNLKIICTEFGCVDNIGEARYYFITDLRKSFEANDIGWVYWAYNRKYFTVFQPGKNKPFMSFNPAISQPGPAENEPLDQKMLDCMFK